MCHENIWQRGLTSKNWAEDRRNDRYRGQGPKRLHGKAKVSTTAQNCAWAGCKAQIYKHMRLCWNCAHKPAHKYCLWRRKVSGARDGVCYTTIGEIMPKAIVWMCVISLHVWRRAPSRKTVELRHLTAPDSSSLCPRSPQMQIIKSWNSFGLTSLRNNIKKASSNRACSGEYLLWQGESYRNHNSTKTPIGTCLSSTDSPFLC